MKKKILLLLLLLAFSIIAFLAGAFFLYKKYAPLITVNINTNKSTTQNGKTDTEKTKETETEKATQDAKNIYKNAKYGFELTLPDYWADYNYKVSEGSYPNYSVISFSFPEGHQPFSIIQLVYYNKEQLEKLGANAPMDVVYQDDKGTLFCDSCCNAEQGFTGGGQFDEFQVARCEEVPNIIKTIKIL